MARRRGHSNAVHRAGQSLAERACGKLPWQVAGRLSEPGSLRQFAGGQSAGGTVAPAVQSETTAQLARVSDPPGICAAIQLEASGRYAPLRFELKAPEKQAKTNFETRPLCGVRSGS